MKSVNWLVSKAIPTSQHCKKSLPKMSVAGGFWAVILSRATWKKSWAGHDPTHSIIVVDRNVAITGDTAWAQLLTA